MLLRVLCTKCKTNGQWETHICSHAASLKIINGFTYILITLVVSLQKLIGKFNFDMHRPYFILYELQLFFIKLVKNKPSYGNKMYHIHLLFETFDAMII